MKIVEKQNLLTEFKIQSDDFTSFDNVIDDIPALGENGPWLAGGSIRRLFVGQDPMAGDFDIFFANSKQKELYSESLVNIYGFTKLKTDHYVDTYESESKVKIQLIGITFYTSVAEMLNDFDMTIVQGAFDGHKFYFEEKFIDDNTNMVIRINKVKYFDRLLTRLIKYHQFGYTPDDITVSQVVNHVDALYRRKYERKIDKKDIYKYKAETIQSDGIIDNKNDFEHAFDKWITESNERLDKKRDPGKDRKDPFEYVRMKQRSRYL